MPTDHISFFQSWNLKHANINFGLSKRLVENFADQASNPIRVTTQSARQWQEQILYLLELQ